MLRPAKKCDRFASIRAVRFARPSALWSRERNGVAVQMGQDSYVCPTVSLMWKLKQSFIGEAGLAILSAFGGARGWIFYKTGSGKPGRWKIGTRGFEQISQADHPSMHSGCKWPCGAKLSGLAPETITIQSA